MSDSLIGTTHDDLISKGEAKSTMSLFTSDLSRKKELKGACVEELCRLSV